MLSKGITASCLIRPLKSQHDIIGIILDYSADIPDDDINEKESIDEYILLNVSQMAFLEETRLSNIAKDEEAMRVNVWQNEIRNNFANSTKKIDEDDEFDTESLDDDEIWREDDNDTEWDTGSSE